MWFRNELSSLAEVSLYRCTEITLPQNRWHKNNGWWVGRDFRHKVLTAVSIQVMILQKSSSKYFCMWHIIWKFFFLLIHNLSLKGKSGARFIIVLVLHFSKCWTNRWPVASTKIIRINQFLCLAFAMQTIGSLHYPATGHDTRFGNPCSRIWCYVGWETVSSGMMLTTYGTMWTTREMLVFTYRIVCIVKQKWC